MSIVVPSAAKKVADKWPTAAQEAGRKDLLFLDANAISPMTADAIAEVLDAGRREFCRRLYHRLRGEDGEGHDRLCFRAAGKRLHALEAFNIPLKILGPGTNQASAFKVVYAGLTKGFAGTVLRVVHGRAEVRLAERDSRSIRRELSRFDRQGFFEHRRSADSRRPARRGDGRAEAHFQSTMVWNHSWRRRRKKFCESIAALETGPSVRQRRAPGRPAETLELFYEKGLLQSEIQRRKFLTRP